MRQVIRCHHDLHCVDHKAVRDYMLREFHYDLYELGRMRASEIVCEESDFVLASAECTYLPSSFQLGDVGYNRAITPENALEEGEINPYVFVVEDARANRHQACFRTDGDDMAAFSARGDDAFPYCLAPGGSPEDVAAARALGADRFAANSRKWLSCLVTSSVRQSAHLAADLFDWWYGARGGDNQNRLEGCANSQLIATSEFINVRRALITCVTVREVRQVFKALDADIQLIAAGEDAMDAPRPSAVPRKRPRQASALAVLDVWDGFVDSGAVTVDSVDAIVDFCLRYDTEYEKHSRFSGVADRLLAVLGTSDSPLISNLLAESVRV